MFNVIWPLASSRENFKLHMIIGNVSIYFAMQYIFIKIFLYVIATILRVATY